MGLDGDPPPAPGRPLQAEQGSTLHRYSIGCSLSHAQSQCLGERKKKLKNRKTKERKKEITEFLPVRISVKKKTSLVVDHCRSSVVELQT